MDLYSQRSQNLLLHVNLDLEAYDGCLIEETHSFLFALFDDFKRWSTAIFFISLGLMNSKWKDLYHKLEGGAPSLKALELTCDVYKNGGPCDIFPSLLWKNATRLSKLAIKMEEMRVPGDDEDLIADLNASGKCPKCLWVLCLWEWIFDVFVFGKTIFGLFSSEQYLWHIFNTSQSLRVFLSLFS